MVQGLGTPLYLFPLPVPYTGVGSDVVCVSPGDRVPSGPSANYSVESTKNLYNQVDSSSLCPTAAYYGES